MVDLEEVGLNSSPEVLEPRSAPPGRGKLKTFLLAFAVILFNAVGNLCLAWGMKHLGESMGWNPLGYVRAILNPFVASGVALLILWLLTRMALMSWADLSFSLPLTGVGYVLAAVLGKLFLDEAVSPKHWLGTLLIFGGAAIVGTTAHQTEPQPEPEP
ncbi:MAG TPA: hypothetical protein VH601_09640 [Bryobacteraceae bacterium]|jgi:uncharacterized membrane protein